MMTKKRFLAYCASLEGAVIDHPFMGDPVTTVARHERNKKWFAILMNRDGRDFVNLKCESIKGGLLRAGYAGIRPAYHMNKEHWISVDLDGDVPKELMESLIRDSYTLTAPGLQKFRPKPERQPQEKGS